MSLKAKAKKIVRAAKKGEGQISLREVVADNRAQYADLIGHIMEIVEKRKRRGKSLIRLVA